MENLLCDIQKLYIRPYLISSVRLSKGSKVCSLLATSFTAFVFHVMFLLLVPFVKDDVGE